MNLNKRIDPKVIFPHLAFFNATELMAICDIYECVESYHGEGSSLAEDAADCPGGLAEKLFNLRSMILATHADTLHCGQCGRLYSPTTHDAASDGVPWNEPCEECAAEEKTRAWVLPSQVRHANPIR